MANRQSKLSTYRVVCRKSIELESTRDVQARSVEEAEGLVESMYEDNPSLWGSGVMFAASVKGKKLRG